MTRSLARFRTRPFRQLAAAVPLLLLLAACAAPVAPPKAETVLFPPPPALPRVQWLASYTARGDVENQSSFDRFVVGEKPNVAIDKPYGVAISDGKIYVCDSNRSVVVLDLPGRKFGLLRGAAGEGSLVQPLNVSLGAEGRKYVSDPGRGQVVVFDRADEYLRAYGEPGGWRPVDAAPFGDHLYVVDSENRLVKVFDLASGEIVRTIGDKGEDAERLDRPTNVAIDSAGFVYVTDLGRFQVVKFDRDGHFRSAYGKLGDSYGHFARPKGIAVDREGRLFAVDASFNNVQIFSPSGRLLLFFGGPGERPGDLRLPAKVAVDYDNVKAFEHLAAPGFRIELLLLVTSQFGDRRVNVYGFGAQEGKHYPTEEELLREIAEKRREAKEKLKAMGEPPASTATPAPEKREN